MRLTMVVFGACLFSCRAGAVDHAEVPAASAAKPAASASSAPLAASRGSVAAALQAVNQVPVQAGSAAPPSPRSPAETARADEAAVREQALAMRLKASFARLAKSNQALRPPVARKSIPRGASSAPPALAATPHFSPDHWDYVGDSGPQNWARINPEWARCGSGKRQSPIDLHDAIRVDLDAIKFDYKPAHFSVLDNGHAIAANLGAGNSIIVMGRRYELMQMHFHRPSEEAINGKGFPMVAHLVHKDLDGKLAVVALMIAEGAAQSVVQTVLNNLPLEKNDASTPIGLLDMSQVLPLQREYFTFMGSLTTPPCTEGVLWLVMKQPIELAPQQIAIFARLYPMNARPIQAGGDRMIKESN